jgi:dTDP-4-amino-4,6-dideoxygalactose transaminase
MSVEALAAKLEAAERDGRLPKIVVPVDFSGLPSDLPEIRALADRYGFSIVADSSHAVGATLEGQPVGGRYADITIFSFHPVKIITTAEGGMCVTQDAALAEKLRLLRSHGITRDPAQMTGMPDGPWYYEQIALGFNFRMTDMQAALGASQITRLPALHAARDARARQYDGHLADLPLRLPARRNDRQSAHHLYVVEIDETRTSIDRASLFKALADDGISANVHYIPIHLQPYYRALGFGPGDFPAAEAYYRRAVTLPLFPEMTDVHVDRVVASLRKALA